MFVCTWVAMLVDLYMLVCVVVIAFYFRTHYDCKTALTVICSLKFPSWSSSNSMLNRTSADKVTTVVGALQIKAYYHEGIYVFEVEGNICSPWP